MTLPRAVLAVTVLAFLGSVAGAERTGSSPPPSVSAPCGGRYDPSTVATIRGKVARVEHVASRRGVADGVHVILGAADGRASTVHLGPARFLENQGLALRPGDALEVTGSRLIVDGRPVLVARKVVRGDDVVVLRDESGVPRWGGARGAGALSEPERRALRDALVDEYRARETYDQVVRDLGPVRPFIRIRDAEARHIEALRAVFLRYGLEPPEDAWRGRVPRYATSRAACQAAVRAEQQNVALFERLERVTSRPDILVVADNLKRASRDRHLPAFRRCAERR